MSSLFYLQPLAFTSQSQDARRGRGAGGSSEGLWFPAEMAGRRGSQPSCCCSLIPIPQPGRAQGGSAHTPESTAKISRLSIALLPAPPRDAAPLENDFFTDFSDCKIRQRFQIHLRYFLHLSCYRISEVHDFYALIIWKQALRKQAGLVTVTIW